MPNHDEKPHLKKHRFTTGRDDPLIKQINIRVDELMFGELKKIENYPEFVRQAIQKALDADNPDQGTDV